MQDFYAFSFLHYFYIEVVLGKQPPRNKNEDTPIEDPQKWCHYLINTPDCFGLYKTIYDTCETD